MPRVYISGPMTGLPDNNRPAFKAAAQELRSAGYEVCNPADIEIADGTWEDYMRKDIAELVTCDMVFLLDGWENSPGAKFEVDIARQLNMPTKLYSTWRAYVPRSIRAGDGVYHVPTGETWHVLGVNSKRGKLCVAGWPPTEADIKDCVLMERGNGIHEHERLYRDNHFGSGWDE